MSSYRNLRITAITIPETDEDDKKTGKYITLEVAGMEILRTTAQVYEGGSVIADKIHFICFQKDEGQPQKLFIIDPTEYDEIIVKKYEHEINEFRSGSKAQSRRKEGTIRTFNHPGNSKDNVKV